MPICTLTDVKTILQITDNTNDALISFLIPLVQKKVIGYCRNEFLDYNHQIINNGFVFHASPAKIVDLNSALALNGIGAGEVKVFGSYYNDGIFAVTSATASELILAEGTNITEETYQVNSVILTKVSFPADIVIPASFYIKYLLTKEGKMVKSETLPGSYSADFLSEADVLKQFNQYRKPL